MVNVVAGMTIFAREHKEMSFYEQEVKRLSAAVYPRPEQSRRIVEAKDHMVRHFASRMDLDQIAGCALISRYHFLRLSKQHYGMTPHAYLTMLRMRQARHLLLAGKNVREVCAAVGFDSESSFRALYKRYYRMTPQESKIREGGEC